MNQRIPAGVVTATDKLTRGLEKAGAVGVDDIAHLWKVYTTQSSKIQDRVVRRLENLFWRIWGNPELLKRVSGVTLATLFMEIHEDSTFHTKSPETLSKTTESRSNDTTQVTILTITHERNTAKPAPKKDAKSPLPPILKNSNGGKKSQPPSEPSSYKTARIIIPDQPSQRPTNSKSPATAATVTATTTASSNVDSTNTAQKQGRKKPTFVANTSASSRRRGVLIRRKSTQTSPLTSPAIEPEDEALLELKIAPKQAIIEELTEEALSHAKVPEPEPEALWQSLSYLKLGGDDIISTQSSKQPSLAASLSTSPPPTNFYASSVHRHRSLDENNNPNPAPTSQQQNTVQSSSNDDETDPTSLVDRDFRTHFVERRRRQESVFNASSLISNLSSSHIKDLTNQPTIAAAAETGPRRPTRSLSPTTTRHVVLPKHGSMTSPTISVASSVAIGGGSTQQAGKDVLPYASTSITTSQKTTSGVFSVSKQSPGQVGERLSSLMKSK